MNRTRSAPPWAARIVGNIVIGPGPGLSHPPEGVTIGAPVRVVFDDVAEDVSLPRWLLA